MGNLSMDNTSIDMMVHIKKLIGTQLQYGIKSVDSDLYQLGFGEIVAQEVWNGSLLEINKYAIHFTSALLVYWKDGNTNEFYADTSPKEFDFAILQMIGCQVSRIALSDKNDLWIDLGICSIVIVTYDDAEESWRLFQPRTNNPHLIASSCSLTLDEGTGDDLCEPS